MAKQAHNIDKGRETKRDYHLDNTVINSIITALLIITTSVDKFLLIEMRNCSFNIIINYKFEITFI